MQKSRNKPWKGKLPLQENLKIRAPEMVTEYFEAGRRAFTPGTSWDDMHQFRLATKRFRYTLEILRPAYGPGIEPRIESLRKLQTRLGEINDCVVTSGMLSNLPGTEELRRVLDGRANTRSEKLRAFWWREFDTPGACDRWRQYLRLWACRSKIPVSRAGSAKAEVPSQPGAAEPAGGALSAHSTRV